MKVTDTDFYAYHGVLDGLMKGNLHFVPYWYVSKILYYTVLTTGK